MQIINVASPQVGRLSDIQKRCSTTTTELLLRSCLTLCQTKPGRLLKHLHVCNIVSNLILKFYCRNKWVLIRVEKLQDYRCYVNVRKIILKRVDLLHKQLSLSVCTPHLHEVAVWKSLTIYFCFIPPAVSMPTNVFRIICYCNNSYPKDQVVTPIIILCTLYYDLCSCIDAVHTLSLNFIPKLRLDSLLRKPRK